MPPRFLSALARLAVALAMFAAAPPLRAETPPPEKAAAETPAPFEADRRVTRHVLELADGAIAYTATAEFLPLRDERGEGAVQARVFTVSYTVDDDKGDRPVAFVFNGGPGAASAYLHLGALGPTVAAFGPDGTLPRPPLELVDNPHTWLAFADLVFVDPVGTGFSRALTPGDEAMKRFWSIEGDAESLTEVVRHWLNANARWGSPKFLVGESYGGFRVARMAQALFEGPGVAVNGLILVSPVVDFATIRGGESSLLPWALRLPVYAATAARHGKAPGDPREAAEAARAFAMGEYVAGLASFDEAAPAASRPLFETTARLIGLPADLVERHRGMVPMDVFARELLRAEGLLVSVYDGGFVAPDPHPAAARLSVDPYLDGTKPAYATAYAQLVRDRLGVRLDVPFELLSGRVNRNWDWPDMEAPSALDDLRTVLALSRGLRVLMAHGRLDMVTPYTASLWAAARLNLPADARDRVAVAVYDGGHMMYTLADARAMLEICTAYGTPTGHGRPRAGGGRLPVSGKERGRSPKEAPSSPCQNGLAA